MARIRTIKPEFWTDEKVAELEMGCRLFYIGMWNFSDDFGFVKGNPVLLKSLIFPFDESLGTDDVKRWVEALSVKGMVVRTAYNGESYLYIRTFSIHQKIDKRYQSSFFKNDDVLKGMLECVGGEGAGGTARSRCESDVCTVQEGRGFVNVSESDCKCDGSNVFPEKKLYFDSGVLKGELLTNLWVEKVCQSQGFDVEEFKSFVGHYIQLKELSGECESFTVNQHKRFVLSDFLKGRRVVKYSGGIVQGTAFQINNDLLKRRRNGSVDCDI